MKNTNQMVAFCILLIALFMIGCDETDLIHTPSGEVESDIESEQIRVAVIPPGFTSPFHVAVKDGAVEMGQSIEWTVDVVAPEHEGDFAGQVVLVEQELQKEVFIYRYRK